MSTILYDDFSKNTINNWNIPANMSVSIENGYLNILSTSIIWNSTYGGPYRNISDLSGNFYIESVFTSNFESYAQFFLILRNTAINKHITVGYSDAHGGPDKDIVINTDITSTTLSTNYSGYLKIGIKRTGSTIYVYINNVLQKTLTNYNAVYNEICLNSNGYDIATSSNLKWDYILANDTDDAAITLLPNYLIKQYNNYYSIKPQYYDNITTHTFTPLSLSGGETPNSLDIDSYSFNNIDDLLTQMTVGSDIFIPINKLSDNFDILNFKSK